MCGISENKGLMMHMETKKIAELAKILKQNQLTKLDLTEGETRLVLESVNGRVMTTSVSLGEGERTENVQKNDEQMQIRSEVEALKATKPDAYEQKSPLVGTAYLSAQAGAEPMVKVGDTVKKGDAVCIVESMKMFNAIQADVDGVIAEIAVENGQIVEYGQVLIHIKREGQT